MFVLIMLSFSNQQIQSSTTGHRPKKQNIKTIRSILKQQSQPFFGNNIRQQMYQSLVIRKKVQKTYKSQHSPVYITYSPLLEQMLQAKLKTTVNIASMQIEPIHKTKKFHQMRKGDAKNTKIQVCISGFAKTLQMRNIRTHESAKERRNLVQFSQRPRSSATIIRCRSQAEKRFSSVQNGEKNEQSVQLLRSSAKKELFRKLFEQRRQV